MKLIDEALSRLVYHIKQLSLTKQDKLESGNSIKTIEGNSLLGSGDITILDEIPEEIMDLILGVTESDEYNQLYASKTLVEELLTNINTIVNEINGTK